MPSEHSGYPPTTAKSRGGTSKKITFLREAMPNLRLHPFFNDVRQRFGIAPILSFTGRKAFFGRHAKIGISFGKDRPESTHTCISNFFNPPVFPPLIPIRKYTVFTHLFLQIEKRQYVPPITVIGTIRHHNN